MRTILCLLLLVCATAQTAAEADNAARMDHTLQLIRAWVQGGYDNGAQAAADVANSVPDQLKHRQMYQLFVPVEMPGVPGHTVYQQASVDGSTDPDRIWRNGVLQFVPDTETGTIRERELNFRDPPRFHNAHLAPGSLADLTLDDFEWNPGCDFFLRAAADGSEVRGPVGVCQIEMAGQTLTADDEVVIRPDEFWFLGRYKNAEGRIVWGNASAEHTKMVRTASLAALLKRTATPATE